MLPCGAILFPVIAGILISAVGMEEKVRTRLYAAAAAVTDLLCILEIRSGASVTPVVFSERLEFSFSPDRLGSYVLIAVLILYTAVIIYAFEYMKMEERPNLFFAFLYVSWGALIGVIVSGVTQSALVGFLAGVGIIIWGGWEMAKAMGERDSAGKVHALEIIVGGLIAIGIRTFVGLFGAG